MLCIISLIAKNACIFVFVVVDDDDEEGFKFLAHSEQGATYWCHYQIAIHPPLTKILFFFQLVMQYLYCGGTESLHIRNTEVMEVGMNQMK